MKRLRILSLCSLVVLALSAAVAANASVAVPTWFECAKAVKSGKTYTGRYSGKSCEAAAKVSSGGKYELEEGIGKGKAFKGKGGHVALSIHTSLGDGTVECTSSKDSGAPALPNLETGVTVIFKGCKELGSKVCTSSGAHAGEVRVTGLDGELVYVEESSSAVSLALESEAHPGPEGELASFDCDGLEASITGALSGVRTKDVNVISKEADTAFTGQSQPTVDKGEALMLKAGSGSGGGGGEGGKAFLIGEEVPHENAGDSKTEEITPVKFVALKSGTVEEIFYETGGYLFHPVETSLVLGIQEEKNGKPGKVLGEGTYTGKLDINSVAKVGALKVPIVKGKTYYLDFLPLGGAVTYWYEKSETVIYSVNHKKLVEGPPEDYEWIEEAEAQPIGLWAKGT